jgi:hypothetical protein
MAAIHALRKKEPLHVSSDDVAESNFIEFDYRVAADAFFAEERNHAHGMER